MRFILIRVLASFSLFIPLMVSGQVQDAEFSALSAWELSLGQVIQTDCSIELVNRNTGKIYCFTSEASKSAFQNDMGENIKRATAEYKNLAK
jgi:hypothetical protein